MDVYKEQLVKKQYDSIDRMKKICLIVMMISLCCIAMYVTTFFFLYPPMGFVICVLIVIGGMRLMKNLYYEYEYILTNGDLDIDKIIAKSKRKRLCSIKIANFTRICKYEEGIEPVSDIQSTIIVTDGTSGDIYLAEFSDTDLGVCALYFSPNEEMLEGIKLFLPRSIRGSIK